MAEYIDRENYCKNICQCARDKCNKDKCPIWTAPAADVAPVAHAKWVNPHWLGSTSAANCSACNFEAQHREYRGVQKFYKYCPGCNAKMNLEDRS